MFIHWISEFDSTQIAWTLISAVLLLMTLVPGSAIILNPRLRLRHSALSAEHWFSGLLLHAGAWLLVFQSLAFGPSVGTMPEGSETTGPPQSMEAMIRQAEETVDERHLHGRGGVVGDLSLAGFRKLEAQGNPEEPLFSSRRPYHSLPLSSHTVFHLAVYLSAVVCVVSVALRLEWSVSRMAIFSLAWGGLVYAPVIHWLWGDGWLLVRGSIDSGGACYIILLATTTVILRYRPKVGSVEEQDETEMRTLQDQTRFPIGTALFVTGLIVLMTSLTVPPMTVKGLIVCNAVASAFGGLVVSIFLRAVQAAGKVTACPVQSSVFGLAAVTAGVPLYDTMTAMLVGGSAALLVFSAEKLVLRRYLSQDSAVARGLLMSSFAGLLLVGVLATSTNGVHLWDGHQVRSLLHGRADLLMSQAIAASAFVIYPVTGTLFLRCLIGRRTH